MRYWWVNHKQTFKKEIDGGYIWSPSRNKNGSFNQTYLNLTSTEIGDIVFSYADTLIKAIGIVKANYQKALVPKEFGIVGNQWDKDGYLVGIKWIKLNSPFKPKANIDWVKDLLPSKYSPIQQNGNGNQGVYLAEIDKILAEKLIDSISSKNQDIKFTLEEIKRELKKDGKQRKIEKLPNKLTSISTPQKTYPLPSDEAQSVNEDEGEYISSGKDEREKIKKQIKARRGQKKFRNDLRKRYGNKCIVTGCEILDILEAAHINPYRGKNDNHPANGLLLRSDIHTLFDLDLIGIEPKTFKVHVQEKAKSEYAHIHLKKILITANVYPDKAALEARWKDFIAKANKLNKQNII